MSGFLTLSLILALTALTMCKAQRRLFPSESKSGVLCLNGGSSLSSLSGRHLLCLCPEGFRGSRCETDTSVSCFDGIGQLYAGPVSKSASGRECLEWDSEKVREIGVYPKNPILGGHKHCRNPDFSRRPWCFVKTPSGIMKEDCDIPRCTKDPGSDQDSLAVSHSGWRCGQGEGRSMKVVGGALSTVERHPWMAAVFSRNSRGRFFTCGGSLISPCWILTAAHCFPDGAQTSVHKLSVVLGKKAINETDVQNEQEFRVSKLFIHEHFDNTDGNFNNDIALLKIRGSDGRCAKESSLVKTVCIPGPNESLSDGTSCAVTGYGREHEGSWFYSQYLKEAKVRILSQDLCSSKAYYGNMITENMLCAGSPDWSSDACKGDSGGPLVCRVQDRVFLFGVVSWGEGCSRPFRPGVYAKVSNYYHWILEKSGLTTLS
ncbi:plasminogen activator, urokinase b [Danio aesculapii]|uniref:plasminogen activator, urokinase b n=1 Tax=Danio aesculapii TaxID=1142201 RepID=UPI0024BF791E|nr:plasminogen activator, urokinase b [Danio aesculapii]